MGEGRRRWQASARNHGTRVRVGGLENFVAVVDTKDTDDDREIEAGLDRTGWPGR